MANRRKEDGHVEKPTAAYLLVMVGGVFVLLGGFMTIVFGDLFGGMMLRFGYPAMTGIFSVLWIIGIISGLLMIISASRINSPKKSVVTEWSVIAPVFSMISLFDMGGLWIGFILGFIGSILGIAYGSS